MIGDARSLALLAVALALVALAAIAPTLGDARPANEVPVTDLAGEGDSLSAADGEAWGRTPSKEVALASAPSGAPNAEDTSAESVSVRAATTDERLYVRLRWEDPTRDGQGEVGQYRTPDATSFPDATAVQLPAQAGANPGIAMGSERTPVNVWYWSATGGGEELQASGPGSTSWREPAVEANATYADGSWSVVLARDRATEGANRTSFDANEDVRVAFAVWNGSSAERAGHKAVSEWQYLPLGPGPQGPPYEAILWVVAGLAIVAVIVATAVGVRRT